MVKSMESAKKRMEIDHRTLHLDESEAYHDNGLARVMNFSELVPPEAVSYTHLTVYLSDS